MNYAYLHIVKNSFIENFFTAQSSVTQGVDILLNPEWPADITRHVQTPDVTVPQVLHVQIPVGVLHV